MIKQLKLAHFLNFMQHQIILLKHDTEHFVNFNFYNFYLPQMSLFQMRVYRNRLFHNFGILILICCHMA